MDCAAEYFIEGTHIVFKRISSGKVVKWTIEEEEYFLFHKRWIIVYPNEGKYVTLSHMALPNFSIRENSMITSFILNNIVAYSNLGWKVYFQGIWEMLYSIYCINHGSQNKDNNPQQMKTGKTWAKCLVSVSPRIILWPVFGNVSLCLLIKIIFCLHDNNPDKLYFTTQFKVVINSSK